MSATTLIEALTRRITDTGTKVESAETPSLDGAPEAVTRFVEALASHTFSMDFGSVWVRRMPGAGKLQSLEPAFDMCAFEDWPEAFPGDKSVIFGEHPGGLFYVGVSWHGAQPQIVFADVGEFLFEEAPVEAYPDAKAALALIHDVNKEQPHEALQSLARDCDVEL